MYGLIAVAKSESSSRTKQGSFYIVANDLAKILGMSVIGVDRTVYPFIAMSKPDLVISIGTLNARILSTKLAALTATTPRVIAYGVAEGSAKKLKLISILTNLAVRLNRIHIVVPSNYVKTELQSLGIKIEAVIPHGVDLTEISRASKDKISLPNLNNKIRVLSVFSNLFQSRKTLGLHHVLCAWARVPLGAKKNAVLILKVPKGTGGLINNIANSYGLTKGDYLIVDEWLSRSTLYSLFKSADLYIHGTLADAFGMPLIESLACGTPVIAMNSPPWNEIVNKEVGWLVDIERETRTYRRAIFIHTHNLRIPKIRDMSLKIEAAIQFCKEENYETLRKKCRKHAQPYDIYTTYEKFKRLINEWW